MGIQFDSQTSATSFLKEVAAQSYGSGVLEGIRGGAGSIGLIGGKPVKFNTHWQERCGKATPEMIDSSNALRVSLWNAANKLAIEEFGEQDQSLGYIRTLLGLKEDGSVGANISLLSRKVVAKVLNAIDTMRNEFAHGDKDSVSSFNDIRTASSKGVDTTFDAVWRTAADKNADSFKLDMQQAAEGLGLSLDDGQKAMLAKTYARAMVSEDVTYLPAGHLEHTIALVECLKSGTIPKKDTAMKDTFAFLKRVPQEKRAAAMALALAVGKNVMAQVFRSERVLDELLAMKPSGGVIDAPLLKKWADGKIEAFMRRFPHAPPISGSESDFSTDRLTTARRLGLLMMTDDLGRGDIWRTEGDSSGGINLAGWKTEERSTDVTVLEAMAFNKCPLENLSCQYDEKELVKAWGRGNLSVVMKKEVIPVGLQAINPDNITNLYSQIEGDLPRTQINATFMLPDRTSESFESGSHPKGEIATKKTDEIYSNVRKFLGLSEKQGLTPQAKTTLAMFSQIGMGATQNIGDEHMSRTLTLSRDGEDVLVQAKGINHEDEVDFAFTVRIRPDGSNGYDDIDVHLKPAARAESVA